ncbi:MAG TPA: Fe-S oxidoreductase [Porticoccaceae bacterium]|nr:Fe-S oxidoreductase [Porticoccaceae bacterium]
MTEEKRVREGSLEAPTRHPIDWRSDDFWDRESLDNELERVYDICHGCRRCVSLCEAFPTLFDLVDESETMEVDGVDKADYQKVVDHCYLCDICYMTKCPYVPPHEWNVDFPHLMLRAKAANFRKNGASFRDKTLTSTDRVGKLATIPVVDLMVNKLNGNAAFRKGFEAAFGVHRDAPVPAYHAKTLRKSVSAFGTDSSSQATEVGPTKGKVALYATCYGNYNSPDLGEDFYRVFQHNGIHIDLVPREQCCGMPKLELGDLDAVDRAKQANIPVLARLVDEGYDLIAPVPSCVLMYKQELPLMYPDDEQVQKVKEAFYDPFEYLFLRHKGGALNTDFAGGLGDISYHVACHLRVQNIGLKTRDVLALIPDTTVHPQERCSGHDGTYAVKRETYASAVKIARPVVRKVDQLKADHFASDCPMAAAHIADLAESVEKPRHPMSLLRQAYGL